jgi:hypothetical protein
MALFQNDANLVPIDPGNVASNNWIILLEANTIVDSSGELRVAKTTQERKIVKRFFARSCTDTMSTTGLCLWKERRSVGCWPRP